MKTKPTSESKKFVEFVCKIISVLACLILISISNSKIVNYFKSKEKVKQRQDEALNLKEIQIPELGLKYLKSCH